MLCCIIGIKKLNNIIINHLPNPRASVLLDKWRFDLSQDWETLVLDFKSFSTNDIADKSFQALGFHISAIGYLKEGFSHFTNVTDLELTTELAMVDNFGQIVTDSEKELLNKKNKYAVKRKERDMRRCAFIRSLLYLFPKFPLLLLRYIVPAPMFALVLTLIFVSVPCLGSLAD